MCKALADDARRVRLYQSAYWEAKHLFWEVFGADFGRNGISRFQAAHERRILERRSAPRRS